MPQERNGIPDGETLITLKEATALFPRRIAVSSIRRWIKDGLRSKVIEGRVVVLEHKQVGGALWTSAESVRRFINRLNGLDVTDIREISKEGEDAAAS